MEMIRIVNKGHQDLDLKTGHVVPAGDFIEIEKAVWLGVRQWALTGGNIKEIEHGAEIQLPEASVDRIEVAGEIRPIDDAGPEPAEVKKVKAKRPGKRKQD